MAPWAWPWAVLCGAMRGVMPCDAMSFYALIFSCSIRICIVQGMNRVSIDCSMQDTRHHTFSRLAASKPVFCSCHWPCCSNNGTRVNPPIG
eukprot:323697-Chlamydomonas_euryale.AAC.8